MVQTFSLKSKRGCALIVLRGVQEFQSLYSVYFKSYPLYGWIHRSVERRHSILYAGPQQHLVSDRRWQWIQREIWIRGQLWNFLFHTYGISIVKGAWYILTGSGRHSVTSLMAVPLLYLDVIVKFQRARNHTSNKYNLSRRYYKMLVSPSTCKNENNFSTRSTSWIASFIPGIWHSCSLLPKSIAILWTPQSIWYHNRFRAWENYSSISAPTSPWLQRRYVINCGKINGPVLRYSVRKVCSAYRHCNKSCSHLQCFSATVETFLHARPTDPAIKTVHISSPVLLCHGRNFPTCWTHTFPIADLAVFSNINSQGDPICRSSNDLGQSKTHITPMTHRIGNVSFPLGLMLLPIYLEEVWYEIWTPQHVIRWKLNLYDESSNTLHWRMLLFYFEFTQAADVLQRHVTDRYGTTKCRDALPYSRRSSVNQKSQSATSKNATI